MQNHHLPRLDVNPDVQRALKRYCRLEPGETWTDPSGQHQVGCLDASAETAVERLMNGRRATLAVHDPPYNLVAFENRSIAEYIAHS